MEIEDLSCNEVTAKRFITLFYRGASEEKS